MGQAMVSFDLDRIKGFVFATSILKEIVGASAILEEFNRQHMFSIIKTIDKKAQEVFADGGSGLFIVDEEKADEIIETVERECRDKTYGASITGVKVPYSKEEDISVLFKRLTLLLQVKKADKRYRIHPVSSSLMKTCTSCGIEYGNDNCSEEDYPSGSRDEEFLCKSCQLKRDKDLTLKERQAFILAGTNTFTPSTLWERLLYSLKDSFPTGLKTPESFSELGKKSNPENYMALLYFDGNDFGKHLTKLKECQEIHRFSQMVDEALFTSLRSSVAQHLLPRSSKKSYLPLKILFQGGDDLVLVSTAEGALDLAAGICENFAKNTQLADSSLTLSAAVIIAHAKFPFSSLLELAEDALSFTKKQGICRKRVASSTFVDKGFISFQVIHASSSLSFTQEYDELYKDVRRSERNLYRTLRPYTPDELKDLLTLIRDFKGFPRNQLKDLQESIFLDFGNSLIRSLKMLYNLKEKDRERFYGALKEFAPLDSQLHPPWFKKEDLSYCTPFLDMAELYRFCSP